jgi:methylmalonyl-CoA mutase N-terminal domain/subunit
LGRRRIGAARFLDKHEDMTSQAKSGKNILSPSNIEIKRAYSDRDLKSFNPATDLGEPGNFPYTRGIYADMYRGRLWTMRQYAGFGTAEESNKRYAFLLTQGQTGLSIAFDLPTQLGLDSDHPLAHGEVGRVGVAIDSIEDMAILFKGIPLEKVSVSMTINSTASIILAMYLTYAQERKISWSKLRGTIQNDILKEYVSRGTYIFPPRESLRIITDTITFSLENVRFWNTMSISGYHIREAGATAVQELAFTLANAITYVKAAQASGLDVDDFAPRLSFFLSAHNHLFEEIAKFRAARRIWARLMKDVFKAKNPLSWKFRFHTQTSGMALTAQEPDNNVVRVTLQALAAVLGGTQSLHTNSRDEALALPSEESVRIALRTQQILAFESGVADTTDPLGGSYFIESLTTQIEKEVQTYLQKIEDMGGTLKAIENGFIQREIHESAYKYQKQIENNERSIVGLNQFVEKKRGTDFDLSSPSEQVEQTQIEKIQALKARRSGEQVRQKLLSLGNSLKKKQNLLPPILAAVKARATLGEISDVLKEHLGTYKENISF